MVGGQGAVEALPLHVEAAETDAVAHAAGVVEDRPDGAHLPVDLEREGVQCPSGE